MRVRSRFLNDIPAAMIEVENLTGDGAGDGEEAGGGAAGYQAWESRARPGQKRRFRKRRGREDFPVEDIPPDEESVAEQRAARKAIEAADELDPVCDFEVGQRVRHPKFGVGKVVAIKGHGRGTKVTIDFPHRGRKTVALGFTQLSRV